MNSEKKNNILKDISRVSADISTTADEVNKHSHSRKRITEESLVRIETLFSANSSLTEIFESALAHLTDISEKININSHEMKSNLENFDSIIAGISAIESILQTLKGDIEKLKGTIDELREATDDIFSLALNASIASSKYSSSSGVFDILADKLNEMSNYINLNLEGILDLVSPILNSIYEIANNSSTVLAEINSGHETFVRFPAILDRQKDTVSSLIDKATVSGIKLKDERDMLSEMASMARKMDDDASLAINGSANVRKIGENLKVAVDSLIGKADVSADEIAVVMEQGVLIKNSAMSVNERSRNQLDFSKSSVDFCDLIISEASEFLAIAVIFGDLIAENNSLSTGISENLAQLNIELRHTEVRLNDSYKRIKRFNEEYEHIEQIIEFLKNILKSMNVIGMYSRIESSRDPEEFSGFITISENIKKLQAYIHNNIPVIENNIGSTHRLIEGMNDYFETISTTFILITISAELVIDKFREIIDLSSVSEKINQKIMSESSSAEKELRDLKNSLLELTEIVKKPIEGSAANIDRGAQIVRACSEIFS